MGDEACNFVRTSRAKLGLTIDDFADRLGVTRQSIWRYETDRVSARVAYRIELAVQGLLIEAGLEEPPCA